MANFHPRHNNSELMIILWGTPFLGARIAKEKTILDPQIWHFPVTVRATGRPPLSLKKMMYLKLFTRFFDLSRSVTLRSR